MRVLGRILAFTIFAFLAFAPLIVSKAFATETPQRQQVSVTGNYESNWDAVSLVQDGDRVYGKYVCCGGGTIEGKIIEGRTLRYIWRQPGGWGMGVWNIRPARLEGTWGGNQSESNGGRWDLVMTRSKSQIAK